MTLSPFPSLAAHRQEEEPQQQWPLQEQEWDQERDQERGQELERVQWQDQQNEDEQEDTDTMQGTLHSEHRESDQATDRPSEESLEAASRVNIKRLTKTRRQATYVSSAFFFLSFIFLILTVIGNTSNKPVIKDTWFFNLDLTNIIPASASGDLAFTNSLARSLGLHDFYHVGLWNFCEGYNDEGITHCSKPVSFWWFNPVSILLNELLSGATIALPASVSNILNLIKIASHVMYGCFLTGTVMIFLSSLVPLLLPITIKTRWWSLPLALWTGIAALCVVVATGIATVMFIIFHNTITGQPELNIGAHLGVQMFAYMWIGTAFAVFGFFIHAGLGCCCRSERDIKRGKRMGKEGRNAEKGAEEMTQVEPKDRGIAVRKRRRGQSSAAMLPKFVRSRLSEDVS